MSWWTNIVHKFNPAQPEIVMDEGSSISTDSKYGYRTAFNRLWSVNRGVNMVVMACSSLDYDVKEKKHEGSSPGIRAKTLTTLLNQRPNPYQPMQEFRSNVFTDFLLEGNAFIYYDGAYLYHLPAASVEINPDEKTFVKSYTYNSTIRFAPEEIVHFKDLSSDSIYRGTSRLQAATRNINILYDMLEFQENFFENGAVPSFALGTENTLSQIAKDKTIASWMQKYNPKSGGKKPIIIDSGLKPMQLFTTSFRELDFETSIDGLNVKVLETIGVPPVLLDGGNQANISPNLRLFYLETVMPIVRKFASAMELLSGYDLEAVTSNVTALQPELKDLGSFLVGLVNGGIITANEAREELRYDKLTGPEVEDIRVPANVAGSAEQPNIGGAPKKPKPE